MSTCVGLFHLLSSISTIYSAGLGTKVGIYTIHFSTMLITVFFSFVLNWSGILDIPVAIFFFRASEVSDSLSDILRGVFKFTSSRQHCGADGCYQFPHLFTVRLQIFLSLHLELGSGAAIFLSWLWALGKCCENDDVLSDVAGEQWASWYECTIMTK